MQKRLISLGLALSVAASATALPAYAVEMQPQQEMPAYEVELSESESPASMRAMPEQQQKARASGQQEVYTPEGASYSFTYEVREAWNGPAATITGYQGTLPRDLVLPNEINGMPVTQVEWGAFNADETVVTLTIPANMSTFYPGYGLKNLQAFYVAEGNEWYTAQDGILYRKDMTILYRCPIAKQGVVNIPNTVKRIDSGAYDGCTKMTGSLVLPEGVEEVSYSAFRHSGISGQVSIPASLTILQADAFLETNVTSFSVSPDNLSYSAWDGLLYDKTGCKLVSYPAGLNSNIIVPDGTTELLENSIPSGASHHILYLPKSLMRMERSSVLAYQFDKILYAGSQTDWSQINIEEGNYGLEDAEIYYNQSKPGPCAWRQNSEGYWWYDFGDGEYAVEDCYEIDGNKFLFDENGYMQTGWQDTNYQGEWFYFNESGHMLFGWQQIGGNWYYFDDGGEMYRGAIEIDGMVYSFDEAGVWDGTSRNPVPEGWQQTADGRWWYQLSTGEYQVGIRYSEGAYYYFDESGYMQTGWIQPLWGGWMYADASGNLADGWKQIGGNWYFFKDFEMLSDITTIIDNHYQTFDASGVYTGEGAYVADGWLEDAHGKRFVKDGMLATGHTWINRGLHRFDSRDGYIVSGWTEVVARWCKYWNYFEPSEGLRVTGDQVIDGVSYHFDRSGHMKKRTVTVNTGWQSDSVGWYYNDANGVALKGWQSLEGSWYYFNGSGYMQTGWQWIDGSCYYFYGDGSMATNTTIDGSYVNGSGVWVENSVATGWQSDSVGWYYNDDSGVALKGWQYLDGSWYYFNGSGYMQTGWQWIDGSCYYFYGNGSMATDTTIDGSYVNGSGVWVENPVATGWQSDSTGWYYNDDSGVALKGWQNLEGSWFYFNESGYMQTGWQWIGGCWFYFNGSGYMQTGWQLIDGSWYYFYESGAMAVNTTIDGYTVNGSGVMI